MADESDSRREPSLSIAEITELAGGLAHELRNPLSTMMINLKLLAEDLSEPQGGSDAGRRRALLKVEILRREAERLQRLFDDFLNLMGPCRLQKRKTDLNALISRVVEFFEPLARSHRIIIGFERSEPAIVIPVDDILLSQALLNLVINGQEAMPDGGTLTIALTADPSNVTIVVNDTGLGIQPECRDRIFQPFFSTKGKGTGLGLPICRRIVQEHGGHISFTSEPGKGATFTLRLPAA